MYPGSDFDAKCCVVQNPKVLLGDAKIHRGDGYDSYVRKLP